MPVEYRINREKTKSFLENMTLLVSFIATILVIGSNDLFYALTNSYYSETVVTRREFILSDVRDVNGRLSSSFLLFPGLTAHMMIDVFYLAFSTLLIMVVFPLTIVLNYDSYKYHVLVEKFEKYWKFLTLLIPVTTLILHLFGNFYYQFYCDIKVIPQENCFWMFDYRSFLTGVAGIITTIPATVLSFFILRYLYRAITCNQCCERVVTPDPIPRPLPLPLDPPTYHKTPLPI